MCSHTIHVFEETACIKTIYSAPRLSFNVSSVYVIKKVKVTSCYSHLYHVQIIFNKAPCNTTIYSTPRLSFIMSKLQKKPM